MRDVESLSREELIDVIIDQHRLIERLQTDGEFPASLHEIRRA